MKNMVGSKKYINLDISKLEKHEMDKKPILKLPYACSVKSSRRIFTISAYLHIVSSSKN